MGNPSSRPGFKALLREWNQKLRDSGFQDIEEYRHGTFQLRRSGTIGRLERMPAEVREAKAQYFEIIGQKIVETEFDDAMEKQILCHYFEGKTQAEIRRLLDPPPHRSTVYKKLYKWLRRWGLK